MGMYSHPGAQLSPVDPKGAPVERFVVVAQDQNGNTTVYGQSEGEPWTDKAHAEAAASDPVETLEPGTTTVACRLEGWPE